MTKGSKEEKKARVLLSIIKMSFAVSFVPHMHKLIYR